MEKEEIALEESISGDGYTIVAITRKSFGYQRNKEGRFFFGTKHPLAVIVTTSSKKVFHMIEDHVSSEKLIKEIPELKSLLGE
jgi:hypothetical protein